MRAVAAILGGLVVAALVVLLGPREMVVCSQAAWPSSTFGDLFGQVDGESFTGCAVPSGATWAVAGAVAVSPVAASVAVAFDRRRRSVGAAARGRSIGAVPDASPVADATHAVLLAVRLRAVASPDAEPLPDTSAGPPGS